MSASFNTEARYFDSHFDELLRKYENRVIALKGETVLGSFISEDEAISTLSKEHRLGTFFLRRVSAEPELHIRRYQSRAIINP